MLTIKQLNQLLNCNNDQPVAELIHSLALAAEKYPDLQQISGHYLSQLQQELHQQLALTAIPAKLAQQLEDYQYYQQLCCEQFTQQLAHICQRLTAVNSPFAPLARQLQANNPQFTPAIQALFLRHWHTSLLMQAEAFKQQTLNEQRQRLLSDLQQRLTLTNKLLPVLAENKVAAGRLWDMSQGKQSSENYQLIVQYGDFLAKQADLLHLAEQLGRSRQQQPQASAEKQLTPDTVLLREPGNVPEQINGLCQSDDILRLLPAEQVAFATNELEYEFYRRMLEKTLLTYRLSGDHWRKKIRPQPHSQPPHTPQQKGAFIVCVDTSGSMGSFNEQCAKAFCLALTRIALAEQRGCFILLFSTELVCYEATARQGLNQLLHFLSQRFRGGTDLSRCLTEACAKIYQQRWQQADVVVISDFIAQRLPEQQIQQIQQLQQQQHRFHAVAISRHGKPAIMRIFDHIWWLNMGFSSRLLSF